LATARLGPHSKPCLAEIRFGNTRMTVDEFC
jgi:hypothetical protein